MNDNYIVCSEEGESSLLPPNRGVMKTAGDLLPGLGRRDNQEQYTLRPQGSPMYPSAYFHTFQIDFCSKKSNFLMKIRR